MDGTRIDGLARAFAQRTGRRSVLRGAGGIAALAGFGAVTNRVAAQEATPEAAGEYVGEPCTRPFTASVSVGPDAGMTMTGFLALVSSQDGRIDRGVFLLEDGRELAVVGQTVGRSIDLMITIEEGQYVFGSGTLEYDLSVCNGEMGGPLVGPAQGDLGDWGTFLSSRPIKEPESSCVKCIKACESAGGKNCASNCTNQKLCS